MRAPDFWRRADSFGARALTPLGALYGRFARARLTRAAPRAAALPAIVIGGLTTGGDGKTPLALAIAARLRTLDERPALLTRGYGRRRAAGEPLLVDRDRHDAHDVGDEALLLAREATTIVGADRAASAQMARELGASVVVLDDGFHSRRVAPDLALLAIDADYGAGNGHCLPAGPLRAPLDAQLTQADAMIIIGDGKAGEAIAREARAFGKATLAARLAPDREACGRLEGARVMAFAGVARPEKFLRTLKSVGAKVVETRWFADHHDYRDSELAALDAEARRCGATLITTQKDAARIGARATSHEILPVELVVDDPQALDATLLHALERARAQQRGT